MHLEPLPMIKKLEQNSERRLATLDFLLSTLDFLLSTFYSRPSTFYSRPLTFYSRLFTLDPRHLTLAIRPSTKTQTPLWSMAYIDSDFVLRYILINPGVNGRVELLILISGAKIKFHPWRHSTLGTQKFGKVLIIYEL